MCRCGAPGLVTISLMIMMGSFNILWSTMEALRGVTMLREQVEHLMRQIVSSEMCCAGQGEAQCLVWACRACKRMRRVMDRSV